MGMLDTKLNKLYDLSADNIVDLLKATREPRWMEDFTFYLNMREFPQTGLMTTPDPKLVRKMKRVERRKEAA